MRISDCSSDVCSSDLPRGLGWYWEWTVSWTCAVRRSTSPEILSPLLSYPQEKRIGIWLNTIRISPPKKRWRACRRHRINRGDGRSACLRWERHRLKLHPLMRIPFAFFACKKKTKYNISRYRKGEDTYTYIST